MFTLMTAALPDRCRRDQTGARRCTDVTANPSTPSTDARTFMDIFACRKCKKGKRNRNKQFADNEGYSSTEEEYYLTPSASTATAPSAAGPAPGNRPKEENNSNQGSLRRPLTCKLPFGIRTPSKKENKPKSPTGETSSASNFVETWRSLPNLRSPSLAVRAMTIKFKALTGKDEAQSESKAAAKTKKKARFNEAVDVILHDDDGKPLYTQSVKIKFDDDGSSALDTSSSRSSSSSSRRMAAANDDHVNGEPRVPSLSHRSPTPEMIRMDYMDIKRHPDGHKFFKCVIFISKEFDRRSITVRTAMGGSRLVLIAHKQEPLGDGTTYLRQYVEKFRLPHAIDPNQVNAVMHAAGDLVIEAPLFEFEAEH